MRLKKFDELNEASDPNDGGNQLPSVIKENIKKLVTDLNEELGKQRFSNDGKNSWQMTIKVPLEHKFSDYILDYVEANSEKYGVKIHVEREQRATWLEFLDEDSVFLIPIITTMHGDDMIYHGNNKLQFGVWLNTYVTQKVK